MTHPGLQHGPKAGPATTRLFDDEWQVIAGAVAQGGGGVAPERLGPRHLFEMAKHQPLEAAIECQRNLSVLENGYQKERRRYIAISYAAAFYTVRDEAELFKFDQLLVNQRVIKKSNVETTRERLIYRMFEVAFAKTGRSSKNTAYRYAHGLEHYFGTGMHPDNVANMLIEHGPEKLYKEAVARNQNDVLHAKMIHQRHIDRAMSDGRYAAKLLALETANVIKAASEDDEATLGDEEDDDDAPFDDDDEEDVQPSWRAKEVAQRFEKMVVLAAQLSAKIAESKLVLEDDPNDEDNPRADDLLRDDNIDTLDWKTAEVQERYEKVLRRAVQLSAELVELKALLHQQIK